MTIRAACFDLDGCLVDSRHAISTAINHALVQIGLPARELADLHQFIGPPLSTTFRQCLAEEGDDPSDLARVEAAIAAYRDVYPEMAMTQTPVFDGITDLLDRLAPHMALAVVTSKPAAYAKPIVEAVGLLDWFTDVHGPELHEIEEPKAVKLRWALRTMHVDQQPRSTVMIGDRRHDIEAGRTCGTQTVGVLWGIGSREELTQAGADHLVASPSDIADVLLD